VEINIQPTPNPNACRFIIDQPVKVEGKSTFKIPPDAEEIPLAKELFKIRGVDQVYFYDNTITITKFTFEPWDEVEESVKETIISLIDDHDPNYEDKDPEKERRASLSPELQKIEDILDDTIRPALQSDGGDMQCLSLVGDVLIIKYVGACGTCPSSTSATYNAILGVLRAEYNEKLEISITE